VEDTFCQVFAIEEEVGGAQYTVELVPGGANIPVTEENRRDFVDKYVEYILVRSVERQYGAFLEGLMMLCKGPAISLFSPVEMERLVCGNPHLDFAALKGASKYEAGFSTTTPAVVWLWEIAQNEFELPEKRMFLKFFTGVHPGPSAPIDMFSTSRASSCFR
jgi:ubiquitin-protein ligase E3 A